MSGLVVLSNDRYGFGSDVWRMAVRWADAHQQPVLLVFSTRRGSTPYARNPVRRLVRRARAARAAAEYRRAVKRHALGDRLMLVDDVNSPDFVDRVPKNSVGLIAGFDQILRPALLDRFGHVVNVHPSVLPYYRGPVPTRWALRNGEQRTGVTFHEATARIDEGTVLHQQALRIGEDRDEEAVEASLSALAAGVVPALLAHLLLGEPFERVLLDADDIYEHPVTYAGFTSAET